MIQKTERKSGGSNKVAVATIRVITHADVLMRLTSACDQSIIA
jgi:hypothetical protein